MANNRYTRFNPEAYEQDNIRRKVAQNNEDAAFEERQKTLERQKKDKEKISKSEVRDRKKQVEEEKKNEEIRRAEGAKKAKEKEDKKIARDMMEQKRKAEQEGKAKRKKRDEMLKSASKKRSTTQQEVSQGHNIVTETYINGEISTMSNGVGVNSVSEKDIEKVTQFKEFLKENGDIEFNDLSEEVKRDFLLQIGVDEVAINPILINEQNGYASEQSDSANTNVRESSASVRDGGDYAPTRNRGSSTTARDGEDYALTRDRESSATVRDEEDYVSSDGVGAGYTTKNNTQFIINAMQQGENGFNIEVKDVKNQESKYNQSAEIGGQKRDIAFSEEDDGAISSDEETDESTSTYYPEDGNYVGTDDSVQMNSTSTQTKTTNTNNNLNNIPGLGIGAMSLGLGGTNTARNSNTHAETPEITPIRRVSAGGAGVTSGIGNSKYSDEGADYAESSEYDRGANMINTAANTARTARRIGGMAKKGSSAVGAAKKGSSALGGAQKAVKGGRIAMILAATPIGWIIAIIAIIILAILLLIGLSSFYFNMPNTVVDKVKAYAEDWFRDIQGVITGRDIVKPHQIENLATYLESMGYDLKFNGFVEEMEKDNKGKITEIKSKYLASYIAAEERGYLFANENGDIPQFFKSWWNDEGSSPRWGIGMIALDTKTVDDLMERKEENQAKYQFDANANPENAGGATTPSSQIKGDNSNGKIGDQLPIKLAFFQQVNSKLANSILDRAKINRTTSELYLSRVNMEWDFWNSRIDTYRYSLKQWIERYGSPMQLFLTLHLATNAPEFAYRIATQMDTMIYVNIVELEEDKVKVELVKPKVDGKGYTELDKNGQPIFIPIDEKDLDGASPKVRSKAENFNSEDVLTYTPYISKVINHWYYKQIIFQSDTEDSNSIPTTGEYKGPINVYEMENLPGGITRYYLFTQEENTDPKEVERVTEEVPEGVYGTLLNYAKKLVRSILSKFGGVLGTIGGQIVDIFEGGGFGNLDPSAMFNGMNGIGEMGDIGSAFQNIGTGMFENLSQGLTSNVTQMWNQGFEGFLKQVSTEFPIDISQISVSDLNFDKIGNLLNFNNISNSFNVDSLISNLNIVENIGQIDLSKIANINQLSSLTSLLDTNNLSNVLSTSGIRDIINFEGMNIGAITDRLYSGLSGNGVNMLSGASLQMLDDIFGGVSPENISKFATASVNGLSQQLVANTSTDFLNQLGGVVRDNFEGQFNTQIATGLTNEFSRQITGLTSSQLNKLSAINNMDIDTVKNTSNKVERLASALRATDNYIQNLTHVCNRITKDMTGYDLSTLNSLLKSEDINELLSQVRHNWYGVTKEELTDFVNRMNIIDPYQSGITKIIEDMKVKTERLEVKELNKSADKLSEYIKNSGEALTGMQDLLNADKNELTDKLNKLHAALKVVIECVNDLDVNTISKMHDNVEGMDNTLLRMLSNQISGLANATLSNLMQEINNISNQVVKDIQNQITTQLVNGLKNQIATEVSKKVAGGVMGNLTSGGGLEAAMGGPQTGMNTPGDPLTEDKQVIDGIDEYVTGWYVKETRYQDYFQKAEPIRIPYDAEHWIQLFVEDKYLMTARAGLGDREGEEDGYLDNTRLDDPTYRTEERRSIWEASNGDIDSVIYGMLESVNNLESQYLLRYFKELFSEYGWALEDAYNKMKEGKPSKPAIGAGSEINKDLFGWIFKTETVDEIINTDTNRVIQVTKAKYEPYTWIANNIGVLIPKKEDEVYGFDKDLEVISPVVGFVVSKTEKRVNELGEVVPGSITIQVRLNDYDKRNEKGDTSLNADGMRVVITGIDVEDNILTGANISKGQVIGKTGTDRIKIMVLTANDHTQVPNLSDYIKPPQETRVEYANQK